MAAELGLAIRRKSASPSSGTNIRREGAEVSKLVDIDLCIGCKACEVACKEWNDLSPDDTFNFGSYQSHEDLTASTWDLMRFKEVDLDNGDLAWLIRKDSCLHCDEPGCLLACPAPGAVVQYENGIVDFDQTKCIGCQYCVTGCPFDIPRFDADTGKVYKCTMCVDRVAGGMEPACVKACPTGSIRFGSREEMVAYGETKVSKLHDRGFDDATLYDPSGVGALHMMYVVPRGDMLDDYGLPEDPDVRANLSYIGRLSNLRKLGALGLWAGVIGAAAYWLRSGRREVGSGPGNGHPEAQSQGQNDSELVRYSLFERALHWTVAITFIALMLSGLALAFPRLAWLSGLFGGGQTMRVAHPWIGVVFSAALLVMVVNWARAMRFESVDWTWFRRLREYVRTGHSDVDNGRWNGGQKGYFWVSLAGGLVLFATGVALWVPSAFGVGILEWSRLIHNVTFLFMVGGLIIHVLLSAFLFSGALRSMTAGRVSRAWAAWHHPRWLRERTEQPEPAES